MPTLKDMFNLLAGELFRNVTPDQFAQNLQMMICMMGSNPFFG